MPVISTAHGFHVEATRVGLEFELTTTRISDGTTVSVVRQSEDDFYALWCEMADVAEFEDEEAFAAGFDAAS